MRNKIIVITVLFVIGAAVSGCGCAKTEESAAVATQQAEPSAEGLLGWEGIQDEFNEMYQYAENIFIGSPVSREYYTEGGLPFTAVTVRIDRAVKGELEEGEVVISYSGGMMNGEMYTSTSVVIPEDGEEYMFLLETHRSEDEYYYPCGGYQGTIKVSGAEDDSVVEEFNPKNLTESDIIGMKLSEINGRD